MLLFLPLFVSLPKWNWMSAGRTKRWRKLREKKSWRRKNWLNNEIKMYNNFHETWWGVSIRGSNQIDLLFGVTLEERELMMNWLALSLKKKLFWNALYIWMKWELPLRFSLLLEDSPSGLSPAECIFKVELLRNTESQPEILGICYGMNYWHI